MVGWGVGGWGEVGGVVMVVVGMAIGMAMGRVSVTRGREEVVV